MLADNCRQVQDPVFQFRQFNAAIKSEQNGIFFFFRRLYVDAGHKNAGRSQVNHILNWHEMAFSDLAVERHAQQKTEMRGRICSHYCPVSWSMTLKAI